MEVWAGVRASSGVGGVVCASQHGGEIDLLMGGCIRGWRGWNYN